MEVDGESVSLTQPVSHIALGRAIDKTEKRMNKVQLHIADGHCKLYTQPPILDLFLHFLYLNFFVRLDAYGLAVLEGLSTAYMAALKNLKHQSRRFDLHAAMLNPFPTQSR